MFQQDIQLKQSAERILKSKLRDQRIQQARVRRYFQQYCLDQRKRLLKKRTNEELILKQAYKDSIRIQRERLREMNKYKQEYNTLFNGDRGILRLENKGLIKMFKSSRDIILVET